MIGNKRKNWLNPKGLQISGEELNKLNGRMLKEIIDKNDLEDYTFAIRVTSKKEKYNDLVNQIADLVFFETDDGNDEIKFEIQLDVEDILEKYMESNFRKYKK